MYIQEYAPSRSHAVWIAVLFFAVVFTPIVKIANLPPLRADDYLIIVLFLAASAWASSRGYSWLWGPGKSAVGVLYLLILAAYVLAYVVGLEAGHYPFLINDAIYTPATILRLFMAFIICASARPDDRGWSIILWTLIVIGLLEAAILGLQTHYVGFREISGRLWGGWAKLFGDVPVPEAEFRASGSFGNPNMAGCILAALAGAGLSVLFYGRGFVSRFILALGAVVAIFGAVVVWTMSRGAVLSALGGTAAFAFFALLRGAHKLRVALATAVVLALAVWFVGAPESMPVPERVKNILRQPGGRGVVEGMYVRFLMWGEKIDVVTARANPLTGYGPTKAGPQTVDNDYVAFYFKTGLLGLLPALLLKAIVTVLTVANVLRARTLPDLGMALFLAFANIVILLFGVTADIFLNSQAGILIAMFAGLTCAQAVALREKQVAAAAEPHELQEFALEPVLEGESLGPV